MLKGKQCPYCPTVLQALEQLAGSGDIGKLESYFIEENPDLAGELGVRSVPWVRIGPFELDGLRSAKELREWANRAGSTRGMADYFNELLSTGNVDKALKIIHADHTSAAALLLLFEDPDTQLNTRIGISAIMEELEGSDLIASLTDRLGLLSQHEDERVRGDAIHYLSLTRSKDAVPFIESHLNDESAGIREIAQESLEILLEELKAND